MGFTHRLALGGKQFCGNPAIPLQDDISSNAFNLSTFLLLCCSFLFRAQTMLQVMRSWDLTMRAELDYRQEAANLREVRNAQINAYHVQRNAIFTVPER